MKQISFNEAAELCFNTKEPIRISPDGERNLFLMNEESFEEFEEYIRVQEINERLNQLESEKLIDGNIVFARLKETYGCDV